METEPIRLADSTPGTATWASVDAAGRLVVELYDHSAEAQARFGNDVAFLLTVGPAGCDVIRRCGAGDAPLPEWVARTFPGYHAFKAWLERNGIPFETAFDSWA